MPEKRNFENELYGTKQVAQLLNIPEWRVKNFAEGKAYGLRPSQKIGSGHGSRRLYDLYGLFRLAIASDLVDAGFTPEAIGRAIRVLRDSVLRSWDKFLADRTRAELQLLVCEEGEWKVQEVNEVRETFKATLESLGPRSHGGLFTLNFLNRIALLENRLESDTKR
jgi:hypothetical protein